MDEGSVCPECPHALSEHVMDFEGGAFVMDCDHADCGCHQEIRYSRRVEDAKFTPEATEALGETRKDSR